MTNRLTQIGFSQRVRLEWLQYTANLVLAGNDKGAVNSALQELLQDKVSVGGKAVRGTREKVISILMEIWLNVPCGLEALRDDGLELLKFLPRKHQITVHWGQACATYLFWGAVAGQTGRLLRLQESVAANQIQRRLREQYGERETVSRAARRVVRSFVDWGVLSETKDKGIYGQGPIGCVDNPRVISWLIEASLHARPNGSALLKELLDSPSLFPFHLAPVSAEQLLSLSHRLDVLHHGDGDLVVLQKGRQRR